MHYERQLCRMFSGGKTCPYQDRCRFLHLRPKNTRQYVGEFRDNSVIPISNSRNSGHGRRESGIMSFDAQVNLKQVLFKTKLCNNWEMVGDCSYGKRCRFAHGQAEMQNLGDYTASEYGIMQATSKTLTTVQKSSAGRMTTDLSPQEQLHEVKFQFKLNELEKISRIYADWVEDMPLLPSSLSKAK
ncbi:Zinc finger CCCH domain-containing protein [Quillaja saponaria]|uniref:Zinc finger CCCH domain-containing protein n=1 Tax=Quillaja saponaria TaxID=32244 RepID=A0AAD7L5C7_QUISA|nr:Zinc finger CCCH domain-containing protein [Quillaja saponaria]